MKKRGHIFSIIFLIIFFIILVIGFVINAIGLIAWTTPDENEIKNERLANNYAKIESFLKEKNDDRTLIVGKTPSDIYQNVEYHLDIDNDLYELIENIEFIEINKEESATCLYYLSYYNNKYNYNAKKEIPMEIWISTKGYVGLSSNVGGTPFCSAYKCRYYHLNDEDYEKLITEVEKIIELGTACIED